MRQLINDEFHHD
ncbi:hypothetical protein A2U01_0105251, partial [Trifolium medium]|nr:hypothetical protein [Trifolium medium]